MEQALRGAAAQSGNGFVPLLGADLDDILCLKEERKVGNDNCVRYKNLSLQIPPGAHGRHYVRRKVRIHEHSDRRLSVFHGPRRLGRYRADGSPAAAARVPSGFLGGAAPKPPKYEDTSTKGAATAFPAAPSLACASVAAYPLPGSAPRILAHLGPLRGAAVAPANGEGRPDRYRAIKSGQSLFAIDTKRLPQLTLLADRLQCPRIRGGS